MTVSQRFLNFEPRVNRAFCPPLDVPVLNDLRRHRRRPPPRTSPTESEAANLLYSSHLTSLGRLRPQNSTQGPSSGCANPRLMGGDGSGR